MIVSKLSWLKTLVITELCWSWRAGVVNKIDHHCYHSSQPCNVVAVELEIYLWKKGNFKLYLKDVPGRKSLPAVKIYSGYWNFNAAQIWWCLGWSHSGHGVKINQTTARSRIIRGSGVCPDLEINPMNLDRLHYVSV